MMKQMNLLILMVAFTACGSPKVEDQSPGSLEVPEFPVAMESALGLNEANADVGKTYSGQMLVWNQDANPEVVAEVVTTLSSSDAPLLRKYNFLRDSVSPEIKNFEDLVSLRNEVLSNADPRISLYQQRLDLARNWFENRLQDNDAVDLPETEIDERLEFAKVSRERFETYCEAKIWQRTFMKPYVNHSYNRRPTPLSVCEEFYGRAGLLNEKSSLCAPSKTGKNYTECLWFEGVVKTKVFQNFWYGNDKVIAGKLLKKEVFDQLFSLATQPDSVFDLGSLLLNGEAVVSEDNIEVLPALGLDSNSFEKFSYKKCRRYREGCTPTIEVSASKLRNVVDYSETDHQILFFTADSRGSNGLSEFAGFDPEGKSANESIFNDSFAVGVSNIDDDLLTLDNLALAIFGPDFPKTVFNRKAQTQLNELNVILEKKVLGFGKLSSLLEKDRETACATEGNFYCPIQDATNASLQLAVRSDVSKGLFRSVTLKASPLAGESTYVISFGFREDSLNTSCVGDEKVTGTTEQCKEDLFDSADYDSSTGQVTMTIESLTLEQLNRLGLNQDNQRPERVDLFDKNSEVTKIDFFEYDLQLLVGKRLSVEMIPYSIDGMFEKMSGTFKITDTNGKDIVIGNLSLRETEATNPWDLMWSEFKASYL